MTMIAQQLPTIPLTSAGTKSAPAMLASVENIMTRPTTTTSMKSSEAPRQNYFHHLLALQRQDAFVGDVDTEERSAVDENDEVSAPESFSLNWLLDDDSVPDFAKSPTTEQNYPYYKEDDDDDDDDTDLWYCTSDDEADNDLDDDSSIRGLSIAQETDTENHQKAPRKTVQFTNIHIREYACTVGDHPLCTDSCPLSLDWEYYEREVPISMATFPNDNLSHTKPYHYRGFARWLTHEERYHRVLEFHGIHSDCLWNESSCPERTSSMPRTA